jgi:Cys-rich repeat protein
VLLVALGALVLLRCSTQRIGLVGCGSDSDCPAGQTCDSQLHCKHPCDVLPLAKQDDQQVGSLIRANLDDGTCFWADRTEVTVAQYRTFVATGSAVARFSDGDLAAYCSSWKQTVFDPETNAADACVLAARSTDNLEAFSSARPVRCIDWCDAAAYCAWVGGALCGGYWFQNTTLTPNDLPDQWGHACSPTNEAYPYGSTPDPVACNVGFSQSECLNNFGHACAPADVGKFSKCVDSRGILDMIGNVAEWSLLCAVSLDGGAPGSDLPCLYRGGSYADSLNAAACRVIGPNVARGSREPWLGFRCCAPLSAAEAAAITAH